VNVAPLRLLRPPILINFQLYCLRMARLENLVEPRIGGSEECRWELGEDQCFDHTFGITVVDFRCMARVVYGVIFVVQCILKVTSK
jgi:hypothetical protein